TPVVDKILASCESLFQGVFANIGLVGDDDLVRLTFNTERLAQASPEDQAKVARLQREFPRPARHSIYGYAIHKNRVLHYPDVLNGADVPAGLRDSARTLGNYAVLYAPMVWEGRGLGALAVHRVPPSPFSERDISLVKTFADQAAIAIQNARLFNETRQALERQTATAAVLRVLGTSMTDTQPVFNAIISNCSNLFHGSRAVLFLTEGTQFRGHASNGKLTGIARPIDRDSAVGACIADMRMIHLPNLEQGAEQYPSVRQMGLADGFLSGLYSPLLRGGRAIGALVVLRRETGAFDDKDISLLRTFSDQAVIAIENVRLFNETEEALERQTATAGILKVISESPTDVQPVFEAIAERARVLCNAVVSGVTRLDGDQVHLVAYRGASPEADEAMRSVFPTPVVGTTITARAIRDRAPVQITDVLADPEYGATDAARLAGYRSNLAVPLLREGRVVGSIAVCRAEVGTFPDKQVKLLQTFADQAVIAIENVRLFNETREALEQQQAAAEILSVISSSVADTQPVFEKILDSGHRLFRSDEMDVLLVDEQGQLQIAAYVGDAHDAVAATFPAPVERTPAGRAIAARRVVHWPDLVSGEDVPGVLRKMAKLAGYTSMAFAPMLWDERGIGAIGVARSKGPFSAKELAMLQTFADQAVIAIQNARLFNETKEALERQTATAEVLQVIGSSVADTAPVFDKILDSCQHLFATEQLGIFQVG
ncbi:MAG TPA: GAF domain-containing protein, partial [Steroidobacteraceae bacterium]|nr:GAF domain-containing protein [Steroidobacteraceae bacterium]